MVEKLRSDWIDPSFNVKNPADPTDLLMDRAPQPPSYFTVQVAAGGGALVFTIGYARVGRIIPATYTVYYASSSASLITFVSAGSSLVTNTGGAFVGSVAAIRDGTRVALVNTTFLTAKGYFFVVAYNVNGLQSLPSILIRSPASQGFVQGAIPPNFRSGSLTKQTVTVNNQTVSRVRASAILPSNQRGVIAVVMTNNGTGYTTPPAVAFSGGIAPDGSNATGSTTLASDGSVSAVKLTSTGSGYIGQPTITFTGGGGANAAAVAVLGASTALDGLQMYLSNYRGGGAVEGPFFPVGFLQPGQELDGIFDLVPDPFNTTTFTFVAVSEDGVRSTAGAPTATLIV